MQEKFNEATLQRPKGSRMLDAWLVTMDLPTSIEQIRKEIAWKENDRNAITVFKTDGLRIVLIALHKGAEMTRHFADGLVSIQVLEGEIFFNAEQQSLALGKGQMLAMHESISHGILAKEETILLLTLTTTTQEKAYKA